RTRSRESPPHKSDLAWWSRLVGQFCPPQPRPPTDAAVRPLSLCTLSSMATHGTPQGAPGRVDRPVDPPVRAHIPATLRRPLQVRLSALMRKSFPGAD